MGARSKSRPVIEALMRRALRLAARGLGRVEPNPMVGCVIARGDKVIGEGYHRKYGGPHAEVEALAACAKAGRDPRGADVYVTLEPCAHYGKTPPCADALVAAKVGRVVAAMVDPFRKVAGAGLARLKRAGIAVEVGLCEPEARELNQPFLKRTATGLPWVIVKWAQTIDGCIATRTGDSKWISGEASRRMVHQLRARVDAIVVGIATVIKDDPLLTARDVPRRRIARRVVIDPTLKLSSDHRLMRSIAAATGVADLKEAQAMLTLGVRREVVDARPRRLVELEDQGVEIVPLPVRDVDGGLFALRPLLKHLSARHEASNVLIEGGGMVIGSLFAEELVDEAMVFIAPKLLGDEAATAPASGRVVTRMGQALPLSLRAISRVGDDVLLSYRCGRSY